MKKISTILSFAFILLIAMIWYLHHHNYKTNTHELVDKKSVAHYLEGNLNIKEGVSYIPTGMFIDSLKFKTANDVYVSGLVWQQYEENQLNNIGVRFPNAVEHFMIEERYREKSNTKTVIGWYFEANLRQEFNYNDYPLDHKTVWIKLLPKNINSDIILVPALDSYKDTSLRASFGIDEEIVLGNWNIDETYFDYLKYERDSTLGLNQSNPIHQLTFNIVIKRKFINAFIINLTLMLVSISLLYSFILMMTKDEKKLPIFGLKLPSTISACAGIFLALLVAHISIRERFQASSFIYIEYFYFLAYFFIVFTVFAHYLFAIKEENKQFKIFIKDAIYLKNLYWPVYFGLLFVFTFMHFNF